MLKETPYKIKIIRRAISVIAFTTSVYKRFSQWQFLSDNSLALFSVPNLQY